MKLAICDDNKNQLHSIAQMLERYVTPEEDPLSTLYVRGV